MSLIFASRDSYYLFYQKPTRITNSADEIQQYSTVSPQMNLFLTVKSGNAHCIKERWIDVVLLLCGM